MTMKMEIFGDESIAYSYEKLGGQYANQYKYSNAEEMFNRALNRKFRIHKNIPHSDISSSYINFSSMMG